MTETQKTGRTIHVQRQQWHQAWDHSIPPIATIQSGETVSFDLLDASNGEIVAESTVEAIRTLDFSRVDQVNGPIFVEGAAPGDTLQVEFLDLQPAEWGWTAIIPGFGLLAAEFPEPALKIWQLEGGADGWAEIRPWYPYSARAFLRGDWSSPRSGRFLIDHSAISAWWQYGYQASHERCPPLFARGSSPEHSSL